MLSPVIYSRRTDKSRSVVGRARGYSVRYDGRRMREDAESLPVDETIRRTTGVQIRRQLAVPEGPRTAAARPAPRGWLRG